MASYPGGPGWEHYRSSLPKAIDSVSDRYNKTSPLEFFERARLGNQLDELKEQMASRLAREGARELIDLKNRELALKEREVAALEKLAAAGDTRHREAEIKHGAR